MKNDKIVQIEYVILVPDGSISLLGEEKGNKYIEKDADSRKIPVHLMEEDAVEIYKSLHAIFGRGEHPSLPWRRGTRLAQPPAKRTGRKSKKVSP